MFSGSPVYSPGDNYPGQVRPATRDFVPSSWTPVSVLGSSGSSMAIAAGVALAIIFWLGRGK
jgi:alkanesulfonate monooxygenase SsuD/methylene tetrahydromethanopterin reductase-like flavin-dependent oxidoreductase (luciferase family)